MSAAVLSDLREPPVVGQFYMVPFVRFMWCNVMANWPVLGPMHTDADILRFEKRHYHVDARFVTAALAKAVRHPGEEIFSAAQRYPLSQRWGSYEPDIPSHRPALRKFKCRSAEFPYHHGHQPTIQELRRHYGDAEAIALPDGRKLCPHRKVDLSQFACDEQGMVTCPLHGLRVRFSPSAPQTFPAGAVHAASDSAPAHHGNSQRSVEAGSERISE